MFKLSLQPETIAAGHKDVDLLNKFLLSCHLDPLRYFCPNGAQEKYINAVIRSIENTKIPIVLCTFANGVGKTTATIHIMLNIIYGPQNGWFDHPIFRNFPFPKNVWYCSSAAAINETVIPTIEGLALKKIFPERIYEESKEGKPFVAKMKFPNGWQISFKTYQQEKQTFESANVGLMINDEPAPESLWKAQKSRRRMGCVTLLPMTPLDCEPYILDEIKKASDEGRKGYFYLTASVYEACKKRGVRGHLDPEIIDDMVQGYDVDEREARAFGKFMYFSRSVYGDILDKNIHVVNPIDCPIPAHSKIIQVVDPHDSRPSASLWAAKTPDGRYIIFNEYPVEQDRSYWEMKRSFDTEVEVQEWAKIEKLNKQSTSLRIMDRHFGWQTRGQKTFALLYHQAGQKIKKPFRFLSSYVGPPGTTGEIAFGHKKVRKQLKPLNDGLPGILIYNTCFHTWNGLTHYVRKQLKGASADEKLQQDAPIVEKYKDFPDLIRYLVCHDLTVKAPGMKKTVVDRHRELVLKYNQKKQGEFAA